MVWQAGAIREATMPDVGRKDVNGGKNETAAAMAAVWSAVAPHAWGLLLHVVPHTPQLLVRLLDLGMKVVPSKEDRAKDG